MQNETKVRKIDSVTELISFLFIWRVNLFVVAWAEFLFRIQQKSPPKKEPNQLSQQKQEFILDEE